MHWRTTPINFARRQAAPWVTAVLLSAGLPAPAATNATLSRAAVDAANRGVGFMGQYQYGPAVEAFAAALQAEPAAATVRLDLAIARFHRNHKEDRDLEAAQELVETVLQRDPDNLRALFFKGIMWQHTGRADAAAPCFERVTRATPDDGVAWYLLGLCRQRLGQPGETEMRRALACRPFLVSACYNLAQIALRAGDQQGGAEFLERFGRLRQSAVAETVEVPQYDRMGDLALAQPLSTAAARTPTAGQLHLAAPRTLCHTPAPPSLAPAAGFGGAAAGDVNGDGYPDLIVPLGDTLHPGRLLLLLGGPGGAFRDATAASGLAAVTNALACALGDYDNDSKLDLFVAGPGGNHLFQGHGDGTFADVTQPAGVGGGAAVSRFALFLDADHDGDLDILVCNAGRTDGAGPAANQLLRNNGDGTFTDIARAAGVACADSFSVYAQAGDLNGDRATDLVIFRQDQPARVFLNALFGKFQELTSSGSGILGDRGAVLQDFDGDGRLDIFALGGQPPALALFLGDGHGHFQPSTAFAELARTAAGWGPLRGLRGADINLDGALDAVIFADQIHLALNEGGGRFVAQTLAATAPGGGTLVGAEVFDLTGDRVPDLLCLERGPTNRISLAAGEFTPSPTALSLFPSGVRSRDGRTRSPAIAYGVKLTQRVSVWEQKTTFSGCWGGPNQCALPIVLGLDGATQADYVNFLWPDGVSQVETGLASGPARTIVETERKSSSCPVLFAWDGRKFAFITDFAGVGGLGYFSAPGVSVPPEPLEHVKLEPGQLAAQAGLYELRVTEPMEETAYIDQLELLAVDHPARLAVFPEEHLAVNGPPATHRLLVVDQPIFPVRAVGPSGEDCTANLRQVDRVYAYAPPLDRRYLGFCHPHTLELDFGGQLADAFAAALPASATATAKDPVPRDAAFLFVQGSIEYPYSQTVYAARQSHIGWEPIRVDRLGRDGRWETIVPDAGAPGGTARMMTIDLTGKIEPSTRKLRLTTNLEIYYDQVFLARHAGLSQVTVHAVPLVGADLRYAGFAREYSPDGRVPLIYDYDRTEPSAPFSTLRGAYTRYGPVTELLRAFDDRYVLVGPGDELAVRFDAAALSEPPQGCHRSFVLVSHAWCKDMDLYTATPANVEPLPFRRMTGYPYPESEHYPTDAAHQAYLNNYNTRLRH